MRAVLALLLVAPLLAGCVGGSDETLEPAVARSGPLPDPVVVLEDAAGDATEHSSDYVDDLVPCLTVPSAPEVPPPCEIAFSLENQGETKGGVPAHPARDVLEVRFQETPTTLEVFLDVASLDEEFTGTYDEETGEGTVYVVTWRDPATGCSVIPQYFVQPLVAGVTAVPWLFTNCWDVLAGGGELTGPCLAPECGWSVETEITHGSPATIHWSVPRRQLASSEAGDTLEGITVASWATFPSEGTRSMWSVTGPVSLERHRIGGNWQYETDRSDLSSPGSFTFTEPRVEEPAPAAVAHVAANPLLRPGGEPTTRLRGLEFEQHATHYRFLVEVEEVRSDPEEVSVGVGFGVPGRAIWFGAAPADGAWSPWSESFSGLPGPPESPTVTLQVEPGTPGWFILDLERASLPPLPADAHLQFLYAFTDTYRSQEHASLGTVSVAETGSRWGDVTDTAPDALLDPPPTGAIDANRVRFTDPAGDVRAPADLTRSAALYDLLGVEISSSDPRLLQVTLSLADLSDLRPPDGYDAVFYALGIEHAHGETMLGHYRSAERAGGEFLCAPDTTVLQEPRGDPAEAAWEPIAGRVLEAGTGNGLSNTATAGAASIVLFAPRSCFDLPDGERSLEVAQLEAGTYLVRRPMLTAAGEATIQELDAATPESELDLVYAATTVPHSPFWSQPFGVENFWDIFGAVVAIITVGITVGLFLRRRRAFHRYLDQVRAITHEHEDPASRARALVALRSALHRDLELHHISDSHYPIVLDRLRARLTSARLTSLGEAFYDLSPSVALRLERLLDDGHLSADEARVLGPLIQGSRMAPATKTRLLESMARWVSEDAEDAAG